MNIRSAQSATSQSATGAWGSLVSRFADGLPEVIVRLANQSARHIHIMPADHFGALFLQVLVNRKKVFNLFEHVRINFRKIFHVAVARIILRNCENFFVTQALVQHLENLDKPNLDQATWKSSRWD